MAEVILQVIFKKKKKKFLLNLFNNFGLKRNLVIK